MNRIEVGDVFAVLATIKPELTLDAMDPDGELNAQGVDSLDMVHLFFVLEERFEIKIDEEAVKDGRWASLCEIADNLSRLLKEKTS